MTGSVPPRKIKLLILTEDEYLTDQGLTKDDFPELKKFKIDDSLLLAAEAGPERVLYHLVSLKGTMCNKINLRVKWLEETRSVCISCKVFKYK